TVQTPARRSARAKHPQAAACPPEFGSTAKNDKHHATAQRFRRKVIGGQPLAPPGQSAVTARERARASQEQGNASPDARYERAHHKATGFLAYPNGSRRTILLMA